MESETSTCLLHHSDCGHRMRQFADKCLVDVQAVALLQIPATQPIGEIVGMLDGGAFMAYYIKRAIDMPDDPASWPGPKAPLAGMALASFFALSACLQGLRA